MLDFAPHAVAIDGKGHSSIRAMKRKRLSDGEPWQKHEFFASPPWAARALFEHVLAIATGEKLRRSAVISEPAAGMGHMSHVLAEYADRVYASDIYPYPVSHAGPAPHIEIADFLSQGWDGPASDWIVTNPPFGMSHLFLDRALGLASRGVAFLQRMQWLESKKRYRDIYLPRPPSLIAPFVERVPMCEGGWDPEGTTATMYAWFVWAREDGGSWPRPLRAGETLRTYLIPPGRKEELTRASDRVLAERCVPGFVPPSRRNGKGAGACASLGDASGAAPESVKWRAGCV